MARWGQAADAIRKMQAEITAARGDLDLILQIGVTFADQAFSEASGASIEFVEGGELVYRAASGTASHSVGMKVAIDNSLSGLCVRTGLPQICRDSEVDPRVDRDACRHVGLRSLIAVPLPVNGQIAGVLKVLSPHPDAFIASDIAIAELLIAPVAYGFSSASAARTQQMFEATFEQAAVGIAHVAPDGHFIRVNARFSEITGYSSDDLVYGGFQQITHAEDLDADLLNLQALLDGTVASYAMEKRYVRPTGDIVWVNLTVSLVRQAEGAPDFFVSVIEDVTARKTAEALAMFDPLTGLPNRRQILKRLDGLLSHQHDARTSACVVYVDLDRFKSVNDRFGHAEGDRCLSMVAAVFQQNMRRGDMAGRLAGDEFVLLLDDCSEEGVRALLGRLDSGIQQLADANGWEIGISAGAVLVPCGLRATGAAILEAADKAMYSAKKARLPAQFAAFVGSL